jgi:hypothetical protein
VRITRVAVTVESDADSVAEMENAIDDAVQTQRSLLLAGDATVSNANARGQRTVSYRPDLPIADGQITRVDFSVEGSRVNEREAQAEIEDWFPSANLSRMAKSSNDFPSSLGCTPSLLALLCFALLVAILVASISGENTGESATFATNSNAATIVPAPNNPTLPPAQPALPVIDCSQIGDEAQRQQCQQAQGGPLCENGCSAYPLRCELQVLKGDIDKQSGQKLYYIQQHPQYTQVLIEPETGERWFCSTQAAEQAGWTPAP